MSIVYLDNAASTSLDPRVAAAMQPFGAESFANPSARHPAGVRAAEALDVARRQVARVCESRPEAVHFTSGGTEANNLAMFGASRVRGSRRARVGGHVLIGPGEHASVRVPAAGLVDEGYEVETLPLTDAGDLDLEAAGRMLRADTLLVAVCLVQGELGCVQPLARLARLVHERAPEAHVHVDAVQAVGKLEVSLVELGADSLTLSAHKLHGPKGSGALVTRPGVQLTPLLLGGEQEHGQRPGTQNVAGAVGLGLAVELADQGLEQAHAHASELRSAFLAELGTHTGLRELAFATQRVDSILALELAHVPAEVALHHLEQERVYVSAGSACQAGKNDVNPTYLAYGMTPEAARRVLRVSFARTTSIDDARRGARALLAVLDSLAASGLALGRHGQGAS